MLTWSSRWFAVNLGTGIVSVLLCDLPYNASWLYWLSLVIFCLNVLVFILFIFISILRYTLYPRIWKAMIRHPTQSLFLGVFPMSLGVILSALIDLGVPTFGRPALLAVWACWWIDAVIALAVCVMIPFIMMRVHKPGPQSMTAAWLLPVLGTVVASATGSVVAGALTNPQHALWTLISSYVLWGAGMSLSMSILIIYFHRLIIHGIPSKDSIVSVLIPLGPLGEGGFAIMKLGSVARKIFPQTQALEDAETHAGNPLYVGGFVIAIVMWGYGLVWLLFALASITRSRFPFNLGWWAFTFPLGVYAVSTITLGSELPSVFFEIFGTVLAAAVILLWIMVTAMTIFKAWSGEIVAPYIAASLSKEDR